MTIQTNATIQPPAADTAARAQEIRRRLPGQARRQRLDTARLEYGPLYSLAEIQQRVAQTLHQKVGFIRRAVFEPIESYQGPIPDEALLKYDAAVQSGLFSAFSVVTPAYFSQKQVDPWIVAQVDGAELYAGIAQWDDAGGRQVALVRRDEVVAQDGGERRRRRLVAPAGPQRDLRPLALRRFAAEIPHPVDKAPLAACPQKARLDGAN